MTLIEFEKVGQKGKLDPFLCWISKIDIHFGTPKKGKAEIGTEGEEHK